MERSNLSARNVVEMVLHAAQTKDKNLFRRVFIKDQELFALFPWGNAVNGYDEFMHSQHDFFASPSIHFEGKIVRSVESASLSQFGAEVQLITQEGEKKRIYINYLLKYDEGLWKIVSIQNTFLPELK